MDPMEVLLEAIRRTFKNLGIDLAKGRTWVVHKTPWTNGRRRTIRIGYDDEGHEIGRTVADQTDDGMGHKTTTTTFYDPQGHETGKMVVDKTTDGEGHTTTTTTTTDARGRETSRTTKSSEAE
jgi:hypothetical protein